MLWTNIEFLESLAADTRKVSGSSLIQCYAPATGQSLGRINPSTADGIDRAIAKAKAAQVQWAQSSFIQRRKVLKTMLKFVLENQEAIARVACLDSGKTMVDASLGEILVTVEKLRWTIKHGEASLRSEKRDTSFLMMYKSNEVIWEPLGVVAACVSWK
jgi:acyl-CoA reductase-like NAD-dependent aldehyde dehydrogenase